MIFTCIIVSFNLYLAALVPSSKHYSGFKVYMDSCLWGLCFFYFFIDHTRLESCVLGAADPGDGSFSEPAFEEFLICWSSEQLSIKVGGINAAERSLERGLEFRG